MEGVIRAFLGSSSGFGYGSGSGFDDGSGSGSGSGYSNGSGSGYGSGSSSGFGYGSGSGFGYGSGSGFDDGSGSGYSNGSGIGAIEGKTVYLIDGVQTLLHIVHSDYAKGSILQSDLTLTPCYIVKKDGQFAHGETMHEARDALLEKLFDDTPEGERIEKFVEAHAFYTAYPNADFFRWHHILTGSCEAGRKAFAKDHGISLSDSMTTEEFLTLTQDSYGGDIIRRVLAKYESMEI